jgi:hypothetical protein
MTGGKRTRRPPHAHESGVNIFETDEGLLIMTDNEIKERLEFLLEEAWLPRRVENAIMQELGRNVRDFQRRRAKAKAQTLWFEIDQLKWRMRQNRERPKGGVHAAAVAKVASKHRMSRPSLERFLSRYPIPQQRRAQWLQTFNRNPSLFLR